MIILWFIDAWTYNTHHSVTYIHQPSHFILELSDEWEASFSSQ